MYLFVQTALFWSCYIDNSVIILSFIHNQIHTYTFIVNNEKLKTSFALIRVLTIVIIDGSANVRFIKGLDVFFSALVLCLRSSIFNEFFFLLFLIFYPSRLYSLSVWSSVFVYCTQGYLQLVKRKLYFCFF